MRTRRCLFCLNLRTLPRLAGVNDRALGQAMMMDRGALVDRTQLAALIANLAIAVDSSDSNSNTGVHQAHAMLQAGTPRSPPYPHPVRLQLPCAHAVSADAVA
eukprot:scaffold52612_cov25-Tisochrysis_lutea.AAC.6